MLYNYHTHTAFCDGKNKPEDIVRKAIELGMDELGFSGHCYTFFDNSYCMSLAQTREYIEEIRQLKEKYAGQIRILLGIEQDYYSTEPTDAYDYVIGAVHYLKKGDIYIPIDESRHIQAIAVTKYYGGDFYSFIEDYYDTVADLYNKTHCDIIAHFDVVTKFNEFGDLFDMNHPRYQAAMRKALDALIDCPAVFEYNTGAIAKRYRKAPYPAKQILELLKERGKKVIFSSDCHDAQYLLCGHEDYIREFGE